MDILTLALAVLLGLAFLHSREQKKRIALLSQHLGPYQIEATMEKLTQGYLRALGETDAARRDQIWQWLVTAESSIVSQFDRFTQDFAKVEASATRVSTLPIALPGAHRWWPGAGFDLREALRIHARGIAEAAANHANRSPRDKAYTLTAELFLMQHTCHWFCRSRGIASARLWRRHQTRHDQVLAAVDPLTRRAYGELTGL
ncbi:MAG: hypothetical protein KIT86_05980 [Hydrogenophaga sp.]|uniref:hypothetical protein n=1 Tax=Hydrogenophaga sp. TaxID=1904254 RepID=UPI0026151D24|nr:hypothetical protein [Hydrogenophaga sp.]MCW5669191.1 hypothetical protein [Hydrogenophaga sp.]